MGFNLKNPIDEIKKWLKKAEDKITGWADDAISDARTSIYSARDGARKWISDTAEHYINELNTVGRNARNSIVSKANDAKEAIAEAGEAVEETFEEKIPEIVTEKIPQALEDFLASAQSGALATVLDRAIHIIEALAPETYTLTIGLELALVVQAEVTISASIPNPVNKITEMRKWAANPPVGRGQIIDCFRDFAPTALTVEGKLCGNGNKATWEGSEMYDAVDSFLEKHGVN